jgi:hypothetical protein
MIIHPQGGLFVAEGLITRETLDLVAALRPFTGERGRKLIDTLVEIAQGAGSEMGAMDVTTMTVRARDLLSDKLDSAVSLSLILAASWLGSALESSGLFRKPGTNQPA